MVFYSARSTVGTGAGSRLDPRIHNVFQTALTAFLYGYWTLIVEDIQILSGRPVDHIIRLSKTSGCDLVVIGCRGYGVLKEAVLGSVSGAVVRHCEKPVMTVRKKPDKKGR